jgi:predicted nucleic acid-binding protein
VKYAVIDSNVYIDEWQAEPHAAFLRDIRREFIIRHSSVVLHELRRGAIKPKAVVIVEALHQLAPVVWDPTAEDWWTSAVVLAELKKKHGFASEKIRALQNDVLIALTCRRFGAALITSNAEDFAPLCRRFRVRMIVPR